MGALNARAGARTWVAVGGAAVVLAMAAWLVACSSAGSGDEYFPLDEGRSWTYRVTTTLDDSAPEIERLTLSNRGPVTLGDIPTMRRRSDSGIDYWLRSDKTRIYRVASRTATDRYPMADEPQRTVLAQPYAIGTKWQTLTTAYVLQRRNEVPKEVKRTHKPFAMTYEIEALDDKIEVPAGKFERCMRVGGRATVRLYVDAQFAWRDIGLTTREWYCAGIGLAKVEREELSPSRFMRGGRVKLELAAWQ